MNVSAAVNLVSPNSSSASKRQDGAFLADHPADKGVDTDQQRELSQVLAQPQAKRCRCRHRCA